MLITRQTKRFLLTMFTLAGLGLVGACTSAGGTGPRVAVMSIQGSSSANSAVNKVVDRRYQLVSNEKYERAASRLDADTSDSRDVRRISRKLDIDAVVEGEMVKRGRKSYELRLILRAGESGKEFDAITVKLRSKKLKKGDMKKVQRKLYSALAVVESTYKDSSRRRGGSAGSRREMDRARKMRDRREERSRRDEDRREAKREKRRRKEDKVARRRSDDDDEDRRRSKRSKKSKKSKKKRKKGSKRVEVVTVRDESGQAIDDEDPF